MSYFNWNSLPPPEDFRLPSYPADSPVWRDEMSTEAFNEVAARASFGDACIDWLVERNSPFGKRFLGDWWWLAFLMRCIAHAEQSDPDCEDSDRFKAFNSVRRQLILTGLRLHLEHAELGLADLCYADLGGAHLEHARLVGARLVRAELGGAHLDHANLFSAHLQYAYFSGAHLEHAILTEANLAHAKLKDTKFDNAKVRSAKAILFDDTRVRRLDIEGAAPDPWSALRRTYTGPKFFFNLLLVAGFLLPYATKILALTTTARTADTLRAAMDSDRPPPAGSEVVADWLAHLDATLTDTPAWWVLLGGTKDWWWFFVPTALAIVFYNFLRGYLTLKIGVLRDQADRVERTPTLKEYYGPCHPLAQKDAGWRRLWAVWKRQAGEWRKSEGRPEGVGVWLWRRKNIVLLNPLPIIGPWRLHLIARVLFWISLLSVLIHVGTWLLTTTVPVPK